MEEAVFKVGDEFAWDNIVWGSELQTTYGDSKDFLMEEKGRVMEIEPWVSAGQENKQDLRVVYDEESEDPVEYFFYHTETRQIPPHIKKWRKRLEKSS